MHVVGTFLGMVFNNHSLPNRCGENISQHSSSDPTQLLHYCPKYSQLQLICLIVSIYNGVPEPFEVFHCHPSSTEEDIHLFLKRVAKHPLQYLVLEVNLLPFRLQEVRLLTDITVMVTSLSFHFSFHFSFPPSFCSSILPSFSHFLSSLCFSLSLSVVSDAVAPGDLQKGDGDFLQHPLPPLHWDCPFCS